MRRPPTGHATDALPSARLSGPRADQRACERMRGLRRDEAGVTLLELLVVLAIVATLAGLGAQVFTSVSSDAEETLAKAEMRTLANAFHRFRRDTGYWPKQGPFAVDASSVEALHPANMAQLFRQPADAGGDDILPYDATSNTGWNGPYLRELDAATVEVGAMGADGTGDPATGTLTTMRGVGDTYDRPATDTGHFLWIAVSDDPSDSEKPLQLGRPILYVPAPDTASGVRCDRACLIGFGEDGAYDLGDGDDIVVELGILD
ncbi:MAG: prepilin-type N-terminal cleavage/methylation domain-containing protein [Pseudomonadota bacterium]